MVDSEVLARQRKFLESLEEKKRQTEETKANSLSERRKLLLDRIERDVAHEEVLMAKENESLGLENGSLEMLAESGFLKLMINVWNLLIDNKEKGSKLNFALKWNGNTIEMDCIVEPIAKALIERSEKESE